MFFHNLYYTLKPFIPRWVQIQVRRQVALRKMARYADVWPIDERAAKPPEGWTGWPEEKRFAIVLTHDVETVAGLEKCKALADHEKECGFRSSFNFVAEGYDIDARLRSYLGENGFEIGIHGLVHKGNLFRSREFFQKQVPRINRYLREWGAVGFRSPCMYHNLEWIGELDIKYDASTFDTDPFEPQPDGVCAIFPFIVPRNPSSQCAMRSALCSMPTSSYYVELPYTLPQDHTLFIIMKEKNIEIWKRKLDWIAEKGGMALLNTHPDYMNFGGKKSGLGEYPVKYYEEFLKYIKDRYKDQYWHVLPKGMTRFWQGLLSI